MEIKNKKVISGKKGQEVGIKISGTSLIGKNDEVYAVKKVL